MRMFFSHPDRPLRDHLQDVSDRVASTFRETGLFGHQLREWLRIITFCHDFGKYTTYFQRHLKGELVGEERYHAELGAMFGSYVAEKTIASLYSPYEVNYYASLFIYYVIHRHHGHLIDWSLVFQKAEHDWSKPKLLDSVAFKNQIADLRRQAAAIDADMRIYAADLAFFIVPFLNNWESHVVEMERKKRQFEFVMARSGLRQLIDSALSLGVMVQHLFSLLIDADKQSAARLAPIVRGELSSAAVEQFRRDKLISAKTSSVGSIADKRTLIKEIVRERVANSDLRQSFHTFTAPTGAGKTLTALEGAVLLRERLSADGSSPRRIIYVLPFTSIIDQNHRIIEEVFCPNGVDHSLVLKHHYLSEIEYRTSDQRNEEPLDTQLMYIESWEAEIIVTTYVQLMHTLLGTKNRQLKKWHRLTGAIVILDEVQNIPFSYWKLTRELCREHSRLFDTKWVLLTATQPHIFPKTETYEWLEHPLHANHTFFQDMSRTSLHLVSTDFLEMDAWLEQAVLLADGVQSVLIIMNTIAASLEVYRYFRDRYGQDEVLYLSANLIPRHRRAVLQRIRERLTEERKRVILVSTQVVEAGVDLDFQRVIRDLGPLDSIIQAAGRCNRHGIRDTEQVFILPLRKRSGSRPDSVLVYGTDAICALKVLTLMHFQCQEGISEARYAELIDLYYREIAGQREDSASKVRLNQLAELSFNKLSEFNFINQTISKYPVFVQFDEEASELWDYYCQHVIQEDDLVKRRENYLSCKARLKEYQVDVSERTLLHHKSLRQQNGFMVILREWVEQGQYYDQTTGFIIDPKDEHAFIW